MITLHSQLTDRIPGSLLTPIAADQPITRNGKFLQCGQQPWYLKGLTYGPFAPNADGCHLPAVDQVRKDFAQIRSLSANAIRVYHVPPRWLLDEAATYGLRVLVDVPWEKHRCFFEDWSAQTAARRNVRTAAAQLGGHPGLLAISVVNEFPVDVTRFYGARRIERFVDDLIAEVKNAAPDCLATFANYPTTEFLCPSAVDFVSFNLYLNDPAALGRYLDRLQHLAGPLPLVLSEYGADSYRQGETEQARLAAEHLQRVFRHGLAGSFVFSFTDDWYTGGHAVEDWAFGLTTRDRQEKPAAAAVKSVWRDAPAVALPRGSAVPKVSVVVCSYNGAATLRECLHSLEELAYPNYEVILVDDGSTDHTPQIAADFPQIRYIRQVNKGLSVARNVGAEAATGEIVAYTDSDCVADTHWLCYLVAAMQDQEVEAIGGPNLPPPSDSWVARCVAASPGGPSHVMLDDRRAEHVPGCNMAFLRSTLLTLGGFDPQFRQAGDDVDICWRFLDAGKPIGYAAAALVWHHRRTSAKAYLKQQKGYGRSEAMLHFKHPHRFNALGCSRWAGVIYGEGAVGLPVRPPSVFHGRFGDGLFQTIYRSNVYSRWSLPILLEWHAAAVAALLIGVVAWPGIAIAGLLWLVTLFAAVRSATFAPLPSGAPWWCRSLVFWMHLSQPVVRAWHRYAYRFGHKQLPADSDDAVGDVPLHRPARGLRDLYWRSSDGIGREQLLARLVTRAHQDGWTGTFGDDWATWDAAIDGDALHDVILHTATEQLGGRKRFTRARISLRTTHFARALITATTLWTVAAFVATATGGLSILAPIAGATFVAAILVASLRSRSRCRRSVGGWLSRCAQDVGLLPVSMADSPRPQASVNETRPAGALEPQPVAP